MITLLLIGIASGIALLSVPAIKSWQHRYKEVRLLTGHRREHLHALWHGNLDEVRVSLNDTKNARHMFVRACAELQANDTAAAQEFLAHVTSDDPAVRVLDNLIARRSSRSDEAWLDSLEHAWLASHRPSLVGNRFANSDLASSHLDPTAGDAFDGSDKVLWAALCVKNKISGAAYPRVVRNWAMDRDAAQRDLGELIISHNLIALDTFGDLTPRMLVPIRDRLVELAPNNFWVRLAHCIAHEDRAGLSGADVDALQGCVQASDVDASLDGVAQRRLHQLVERADVPYPIVATQNASNLCLMLVPLHGLWHRLAETKNYALRQRAAHVLASLSRRMREDNCIFAMVAAYETLSQANAVLMSSRIASELEARRTENDQLLGLADHLILNPFAWPIPGIVDEAAQAEQDDELAFYRRYLGDPNAALPQAWLLQR